MANDQSNNNGSNNEASSLLPGGLTKDRSFDKDKIFSRRSNLLIVMALLVGIVFGVGFVSLFRGFEEPFSSPSSPQTVVVEPVDEPMIEGMSSWSNDTTTTKTLSPTSKHDNKSTKRTKIESQTVVVVEGTSYRGTCRYFAVNSDAKPPRILQTSMHEPAQPWSLHDCLPADDSVVTLNSASAPDAILQVQFDPHTSHHQKKEKSSSSSPEPVPQFRPILGFGGAFTEAAALTYGTLSDQAQTTVAELLFGESGLGYALGRVPIHSCDFSVASYNFANETDDFELNAFDTSVKHDAPMIAFATAALKVYEKSWGRTDGVSAASSSHTTLNHDEKASSTYNFNKNHHAFKLFASPWSPPAWMKRPTWEDSKRAVHARSMTYSATPSCLRDGVGPDSRYAEAWALYFSKFITAYGKHGLDVWAVTVQNEPEFPAPWEACAYSALNMTDFVANHLGPTLERDHAHVKLLAFDHNKDHVNTWMMTMLNGTDDSVEDVDELAAMKTSSQTAAKYVDGTAYHWYAGGMDRLLDGALGMANMHKLQENLATLDVPDHILLGSESCHCPSTGYAGGDIQVYWSRAERYAHTILADLAAGSQGWVEWNLILDGIGGPNHLGNLCDTTILAVPHRAVDAPDNMAPLPDFEAHKPKGGSIVGDDRTREELNALGFSAKFLDLGIAVQPMYYYMGHISRHVRPGSLAVPALVRQSLGHGQVYQPRGTVVAGGGENDLARDGIELLVWPCEGSTRQQFRWNVDNFKHISVLGHDWLGAQTRSCVGRVSDKDLGGVRLGSCEADAAGEFMPMPVEHKAGFYRLKLLNHPVMNDGYCLTIIKLKNGGGMYGPLGGAQVTLGDCMDDSAKWKLNMETGTASSTYFAGDESDNEVCITTGWPFLQMGAFLTPNGSASKTVIILNEAKDSANYALKDGEDYVLTGSIPPRSIQTVLLD